MFIFEPIMAFYKYFFLHRLIFVSFYQFPSKFSMYFFVFTVLFLNIMYFFYTFYIRVAFRFNFETIFSFFIYIAVRL